MKNRYRIMNVSGAILCHQDTAQKAADVVCNLGRELCTTHYVEDLRPVQAFPFSTYHHDGFAFIGAMYGTKESAIAALSKLQPIRSAGYRMSDSGERVYFAKVFDDEMEAARYGDSEAQRLAESECEYQQRFRDAQDAAYNIDDSGRTVDMLFKLRHTEGYDDASAYRTLHDAIDALRTDKKQFADNYSDVEL